MELSTIVGVVFIATAICLVIMKAIREKLIDNNVIFDNLCPICKSELSRIHRRARHRILGLVFFVDVKYYECDNCYKKRLFIGSR